MIVSNLRLVPRLLRFLRGPDSQDGVTEQFELILSYPGLTNPVTLGDTVLLRLN